MLFYLVGFGDWLDDKDTESKINELKDEIKALKEKEKYYITRINNLKKSTSIEVQSGNFERKIIRRGRKKREHLVRKGKNPEKISFGYIGIMEFMGYPYSSFDKIVIRIGGRTAIIDKYDLPKLFKIHNEAKWFIDNGENVINDRLKSDSPLARQVINAYNAGVEREQVLIKASKISEDNELFEYMENMKEHIKNKWLNEDSELAGKYYAYIDRKKKKNKK